MSKKYKLTNNKIQFLGRTLYQIEALRDIRSDVSKGDKGGWIENEENLSQDGYCWVFGDARIFENARVYDNASVYENARVYGDVMVYGNARVYGDVMVYGNTRVSGDAWIYNDARVYGDAWVNENIEITSGHFFGWKNKKEKLAFIDINESYQLIGKGDCKCERYSKEDSKMREAIELLKNNGYKIIKKTKGE